MDVLPDALAALKSIRQFIVCEIVPSTSRAGKTDKLPINYKTGKLINSQDASYWVSFDEANDFVQLGGSRYCVGFVFTENDPYFFIDIDSCLLGEPINDWNDIAKELCRAFNGAAIEISSSGKGLHIFGSGIAPEHSCKYKPLDLEFYTQGRFVALTGFNMIGNINTDFTYLLPWLVESYFKPIPHVNDAINWTTEPVEQWSGTTDDKELINRALRSQSVNAAFGLKASFADLWDADVEALSKYFPDENREYDASSADAALAQHLAFWTGNNCDRIQTLMMQSALVRDKWSREDYLYRTILNACARQTTWIQDKQIELIEHPTTTLQQYIGAKPIEGNTFLAAEGQTQLFYGCVYIRDEHRILVPGGDLLKPEQFRAHFGGYTFTIDQENRRISRNAWEAFTESQLVRFPRAESSCFRPDLAPGALVIDAGKALVNLWWPLEIPAKQGDPKPFITHIEKLVPDKRDQVILISYLASLVQNPGVKFQWAPVLQGTPGNGKTLINKCIAKAVGEAYSHFPSAAEITEKYNDWLYKSLFIGVDDIYAANSKREVLEILKPMITNERLEIRAMYAGKRMRDICCNFIFNCNDKEGLTKTQNDRRFAPFYTAQQSKEDLIRDGMTGSYFPDLYGWLHYEDGFAIVTDYLRRYPIINEFNPANKKPAPITSSTQAAIEFGRGNVEQIILEAIDQGSVGFRNGWVSSTYLEALLEKHGYANKIPINRRPAIMQALEYDLHPGLPGGRAASVIMPDGAKPRLYIHKKNPSRSVVSVNDIVQLYTLAQQ